MQTATKPEYVEDLAQAAEFWRKKQAADVLIFTGGAPGATAELALFIWNDQSPEEARRFLEWIARHSAR